jgi:hypothetical protein
MPTISIKAHYDGTQILLDEPVEIPANSPLIVTVLPVEEAPMDRDSQTIAKQALSGAYGDTEPEYSETDLTRRKTATSS